MATRSRTSVAVLLGLGCGLAALAVVTSPAAIGALVRWSMRPSSPFEDGAPPSAPDYADEAAWSALPSRADAGDATPKGLGGIVQREAPADVFYVHPTSYVGSRWNGPIDDPRLNADTDRVATGIQATAFNGCCAVWAPRYRQANGTAFYAPTVDSRRAVDLAYDDVRRAFASFISQTADRPFVLAGHSQGSILAERLLIEEIAGTALQERLVWAVLPGGTATAAGLREHGLLPCSSGDDLGCVAGWNARGPGFEPNAFELARSDDRELLCTNPLDWSDGVHLGAVFLEDPDSAPRPDFAQSRCQDGTLVLTEVQPMRRDLPSRILDWVLGPENYHPVEVQLFFVNIRESSTRRVQAFLARSGTPPRGLEGR